LQTLQQLEGRVLIRGAGHQLFFQGAAFLLNALILESRDYLLDPFVGFFNLPTDEQKFLGSLEKFRAVEEPKPEGFDFDRLTCVLQVDEFLPKSAKS
jgi:hypothetical protein